MKLLQTLRHATWQRHIAVRTLAGQHSAPNARICAFEASRSRSRAILYALQHPSTRHFASSAAGFRCSDCGATYSKWQGQCSSCNAWSTVAPAAPAAPLYRQANAASFLDKKAKHKPLNSVAWANTTTSSPFHSNDHAPESLALRMNDLQSEAITERIVLPERELNWVLGGGLVPGSLTLVAGNPGIGKSTLALQIANMLASSSSSGSLPGTTTHDVLYVSGEESALQVKMRAERLGDVSDGLYVASETNIDLILQTIESHATFAAVVIDSIQTVYAPDVASAAGAVTQVKECTLRLLRLAKLRNIPVILIGHVTKSGDIAGPKVLEHIVDTVVQLDGDVDSARRFVRCQKNRFGPTSEVGVFDMTDAGLQPLINPLLAFVSTSNDGETLFPGSGDDKDADGASITIAMEGTRPIPLEIQALANRLHVSSGASSSSYSRVRSVGVAFDKLQLLFAVLEQRAQLSMQHQSVFVNVAEGYAIQEPAADLAIAVALASAVLQRPVLSRAVFLGEIALSGHLRPVKLLTTRLAAAAKLGVDVCVIPRVQCRETQRQVAQFDARIRIVEVTTLLDALKIALPLKMEGREKSRAEWGCDEDEDEDDEAVDDR